MSDIVPFDYSALPNDNRGKLMWFASEIRKAISNHVKSALEMGRLLSEARKLLPNETSFREWAAGEFGLSLRTAYNYISANDNFGECANFARIELSAMYELTKNPGAKKAALRLADKGVNVTHEMAKELVAKNKPATPKPPAPQVEDAEFEVVDSEPDSEVEEDDDSGEEASEEAPGTDSPQETNNRPPRNGKEKPVDRGVCPNCRGKKWVEGDDGWACSRCHHPRGEPVGDVDESQVAKRRGLTIKTVEAAMREFDDLNAICANGRHGEAIRLCKSLLEIAKGWK